jgi:hypothetical protein
MTLVGFDTLPADARIWLFASDAPLIGATADRLLAEVDRFLEQWKAHGMPLKAARDWSENHFLTIGIDPSAEQASGCSIDGLFRALRELEQVLGSRLVGGGRVFYRDAEGTVAVASREEFETLTEKGSVVGDTPVYDLSLTSLAEWRRRFETRAADMYAIPQSGTATSRP